MDLQISSAQFESPLESQLVRSLKNATRRFVRASRLNAPNPVERAFANYEASRARLLLFLRERNGSGGSRL
jgi:hypothetical protein